VLRYSWKDIGNDFNGEEPFHVKNCMNWYAPQYSESPAAKVFGHIRRCPCTALALALRCDRLIFDYFFWLVIALYLDNVRRPLSHSQNLFAEPPLALALYAAALFARAGLAPSRLRLAAVSSGRSCRSRAHCAKRIRSSAACRRTGAAKARSPRQTGRRRCAHLRVERSALQRMEPCAVSSAWPVSSSVCGLCSRAALATQRNLVRLCRCLRRPRTPM
jgi:hypothetical protein